MTTNKLHKSFLLKFVSGRWYGTTSGNIPENIETDQGQKSGYNLLQIQCCFFLTDRCSYYEYILHNITHLTLTCQSVKLNPRGQTILFWTFKKILLVILSLRKKGITTSFLKFHHHKSIVLYITQITHNTADPLRHKTYTDETCTVFLSYFFPVHCRNLRICIVGQAL